MKTILFSPATNNFSETTRLIVVADAIRRFFKIIFLSYQGPYEYLIKEAGFPIIRLEPSVKDQENDLKPTERNLAFGYFFNEDEIELQVRHECDLIDQLDPVAVVTGFNFSTSISARAMRVPLIWIAQSTWRMTDWYRSDDATPMDALDFPLIRHLPRRWMTSATLAGLRLMDNLIRPYDKIAKDYGVKPFRKLQNIWSGDYTLLAEPDDFTSLCAGENTFYIGPLIYNLKKPIPKPIKKLPRDRPIIYLYLGDGCGAELTTEILESFGNRPYTVIAPFESPESLDFAAPENIIITERVPAHLVNPMADISVIHGGIGTVMTALLSGTPIIGLSFMPEHEPVLDTIEAKGLGKRIRKKQISANRIQKAIMELLDSPEMLAAAKAYQEKLHKWNDSTRIKEFFKRFQ